MRSTQRRQPDVAQFGLDLEQNLLALQRELVAGEYAPGPYRQFTVYERKPRLISVAPFRGRVAHHAVMNVLEPLLDKRFIPDTCACRKDKGVHRAVDRYRQFARENAYVLKLDIARYFPSVDRAILKQQLARRIKDRFVLALLHRIIDGGPESIEPGRAGRSGQIALQGKKAEASSGSESLGETGGLRCFTHVSGQPGLLVKIGNPPTMLGRLTQFDSSGTLMVSPRCEPPSVTRRRNHERGQQFKTYPLGMCAV